MSDTGVDNENAYSMKLPGPEEGKQTAFNIKLSDAEDNKETAFSLKQSKAEVAKENSYSSKLSGAYLFNDKYNGFSMKLSDANFYSMKLSDVDENRQNAFSMKISDPNEDEQNYFSMKLSDADEVKQNGFCMKLSDSEVYKENLNSMKLSEADEEDQNAILQLSDVEKDKEAAFSKKLSNADEHNTFSMQLIDAKADGQDTLSMKMSNDCPYNKSSLDLNISYQDKWFRTVDCLRNRTSQETLILFLKTWKESIKIFSKEYSTSCMSQTQFAGIFPRIADGTSLKAIRSKVQFQGLFWPFVYKTGFMNQKLGLLGLDSREVPPDEQKSRFYSVIERSLKLGIPFSESKVVYSFDDISSLILNMNRSGLLKISNLYMNTKQHLFTFEERVEITIKADTAMKYLQDVTPELHRTINQLVACFAFYKSEERSHVGGTSCTTPGVIWIDPSGLKNASVQFFVEQIVHEYIHNALCYAEMVHGIFSDHSNLPNAKSMSSIRRELRNYDKSFHAAYVSTGLIAFHARAGSLQRAQDLLPGLRTSVDDLIKVNQQTGILTDSGEAMLQSMTDFLTVVRLR